MKLLAPYLSIKSSEASFARRGFAPTEPPLQDHLERIGVSFLHGYNAALRRSGADAVARQAEDLSPPFRGYAFEGAGMAAGLLDGLSLSGSGRVAALLRSAAGDREAYILHVGAGWALGRLPWGRVKVLSQLDPFLQPLAFDGYGFHDGYFKPTWSIGHQNQPGWLRAYARRAYDQGLGRSLWFVEGADIARIVSRVMGFPETRRADLWSGVGLACAYSGGVGQDDIETLLAASGTLRWHLAQGVAFAAKARLRGGNEARWTELACGVICRLSARRCADIADAALALVDQQAPPEQGYDRWRQTIGVLLADAQTGQVAEEGASGTREMAL